MHFLPAALARAKADSALVLTCKAVAMAYFSNKSMLASARSKRVEAYGRALTATNMLLGHEELRKSDETAMCVFLLGVYEVSEKNVCLLP